jgi:hypothetical protein
MKEVAEKEAAFGFGILTSLERREYNGGIK